MQFENNEDSCDAQILTRIIFYSQVYECFRESHPSLATLDKLLDRFPLRPVTPPIGDTSLTHVMKHMAYSTKPPTFRLHI
jgi:hypothetical protein